MITQSKTLTVVVISVLFLFSGSAALIYEVLWMKQLSLLFGSSSQAAAATLAAFFTGIAAGNAYWGRRASKLARPLLVYGLLELCVTLSALLYFAIYLAYDSIYPTVFSTFADAPKAFVFAKFILALLLFCPAAFFIGGTFPVMTQYLVKNRKTLGQHASSLYSINILGAASGAIAAGFYLPQTHGLDASYMVAMTATLLVGIVAITLDSKTQTTKAEPIQVEPIQKKTQIGDQPKSCPRANLQTLTLLAGFSGFASLALQVLWIRMFAQVLHNSVYTYSAILSVFLVALAVGGIIARELARREVTADWVLPSLLTLTALLIAASAILFHMITEGGSYLGGNKSFTDYLFQIFSLVLIVIGPPTAMMGVLLPYLFKLAESGTTGPGETVGSLVTVNTLGAILGSVAAGFILLDWIGLWSSIKVIAIAYIAAAFWVLISKPAANQVVKLAPIFGLVFLATFLNTSKLPVVKIDSSNNNETLLKVWEGADATVAVIQRNGHLRTKLNNWYTLGSTGDMATQQMQTHLPLLLHPNPKRVFYLGLGTGITAGSALDHKVDKVVVAEISPSAIKASEAYFKEYTNGLYEDPRVTIIAEDGRNVLRGSRISYDLVISDLFIPWKAGTGNLYSVEHYQVAHKRLNTNGMYVQWLPLYQLTQADFAIIARSMQQVFPTVSIWRGNFSGSRPVIALIGHQNTVSLSPHTPLLSSSRLALNEQSDTVPLIAHLAGTLNDNDPRISNAPINTDNHPVIEYLAPINHRQEKAKLTNWFVGQNMLKFLAPYLRDDILSVDPYLSKLNSNWHTAIQSGYYLQASFVLRDKDHSDASAARAKYQSLLRQTAIGLETEH